MVSVGSYVLSAFLLVVLVLSLGFSAVGLRRWLMPEWEGAPARLVEAILGVALLIWLSELLGVFDLLYAGALVAAAVLLAAAVAVGPRVLSRGGGAGEGAGFFAEAREAAVASRVGRKIGRRAPRAPHPRATRGRDGVAARGSSGGYRSSWRWAWLRSSSRTGG